MAKILLIEDSPESRILVTRYLQNEHEIFECATLEQARLFLQKRKYDLILLDLTLPDGDGIEFCTELRKRDAQSSVPIIMLTAKTDVMDRVQGLGAGADDYIPKPFDGRELRARVKALLRRQAQQREVAIIRFGDLVLRLQEGRAYYEPTGQAPTTLDLTPIEFKILVTLSRSLDQPISRQDLLKQIWGNNIHLSERNIDTHVCKLRRKLPYVQIQSKRGVGYKLKLAESIRTTPRYEEDKGTALPLGVV